MSTPPLYTPVNFAVFNERYEEAQQRRGGQFKKYQPRKGEIGKAWRNVFRMMPAHPNMQGDPIVQSLVHFSLGPSLNVFSPCLQWWEEDCPACTWVNELKLRAKRETEPGRRQQFDQIAWDQRQQENFECQVADMIHPEQGVMPYYFSGGVERMLRSCFYSHDQPPQPRDITDPYNGRDIIMDISTKPGPEAYPQYDLVTPKDTPSQLFDMKWLEAIQDLTEDLFKPSRDEVAQALQGKKIDRRGSGRMITAGNPVPAQTALAAPPIAAPTPVAPVPPAPTPVAPVPPAPAAAAAAPPVGGRRRGGRPSAVAAAPTPAGQPVVIEGHATPLPAVPAQPAVVVPETPIRRVAVTDEPALPYAAARTRLQALGVVFKEITKEKTAQKEAEGVGQKVPCYKKGTDPSDKVCQDCIMILPCLTATAGLPE